MKILFILRGRPGLGHVMPGLTLAFGLKELGHEISLSTYAEGHRFLQTSGLDQHFACYNLSIPSEYENWPGLHPYNDSMDHLLPCIDAVRPDFVFFGGEYMGPHAARAFSLPSGMIYNPEIFENKDRNRHASRLFASYFKLCDILVPLTPIGASDRYFAEYHELMAGNLGSGFLSPLLWSRLRPDFGSFGPTILISNGGGVAFPRCTSSYTTENIAGVHWLKQTLSWTNASIQSALQWMRKSAFPSQIRVFSGLSREDNEILARRYAQEPVTIHAPSLDFYAYLQSADLLIARTGAGIISDLHHRAVPAVLWSLEGHDEQLRHATELSRHRPATSACSDPDHMIDALDRVFGAKEDLQRCHECDPHALKTISIALQNRIEELIQRRRQS